MFPDHPKPAPAEFVRADARRAPGPGPPSVVLWFVVAGEPRALDISPRDAADVGRSIDEALDALQTRGQT